MANETPNQPPFLEDYAGVREYIGARYVPVMANPIEWDNGRGYEPLTIVIHEGNSYTSTQTVPPGIDISNTEFWALTGNYDAQIEQYRKEVKEYNDRIKNLEDNFPIKLEDISPSIIDTIPISNSDNLVKSGGIFSSIENLKKHHFINALYPPLDSNLNPLVKNDNTIDNSENLQNLIEYCNENNRVLFIPEGNYYFSTPIIISATPNVYIIGAGKSITSLFYSGNGDFLTIQNKLPNLNFNYGMLKDFSVESIIQDNNAIHLINPENIIIDNISFNDFVKGLIIDSPNKNGNNYISFCGYYSTKNNGVGYEIIGQSVSNYFLNSYASFYEGGENVTSIGFYFHSNSILSDINFVDCETANGYKGFFCEAQNQSIFNTDINFVNCVIDGSFYGIDILNCYSVNIQDSHINIVNGSAPIGVRSINTNETSIIGNAFENMDVNYTTKNGVEILNGSFICDNNAFKNLSSAFICENNTFNGAIGSFSNNYISNDLKPANGVYIMWPSNFCGNISHNIMNFVKDDHDIQVNGNNVICMGNCKCDVQNTSTNGITEYNIGR